MPLFGRRRGERDHRSSETALSEADQVWNRATMELGGWQPREGDAALAALLSIHSLAMSGGLLDAVERHSKEEIDRAVAGFRYFSLDDAAAVVVSIAQQVTVVDIDAEQLEAEANDRYAVAVPNDDSLAARFEQVFRERRDAFAPLE